MTHPVPTGQPCDVPVESIQEVGGIYFRSIMLEKAGMIVWQHVHDHEHATYIGRGSARLWVDGQWIGDYKEDQAVGIEAGKKHMFQALAPNTRLTCVHDVASAEAQKSRSG